MKRFDRKFGADLIANLPASPAVYLFKDEARNVLYVGKAKNVRRRLSSYRNASRRKVHRKMRTLIREAATVEVRIQPNEEEALVVENQLIRELTPPYNVDGRYSFLYPAIGVCSRERHTLLCFTTDIEPWAAYELRWFGTFRSRFRAKEAFDALVALLALIGHLERASTLGRVPRIKGSRLVGIRQLSVALVDAVADFLSGASRDGLIRISTALLEKPRARRDAASVQQLIHVLADFYAADLEPLHATLRNASRVGTFVPQHERDTLFIRHRR